MRKKHLIGKCEILRSDVDARGLASADEMDAEMPERGKRGTMEEWIHYHANLVAFRRREEWHSTTRDAAEERMLAALDEVPIELKLLDGTDVAVHPKSHNALMWFRSRDWLVGWISSRVEALQHAANTGELEHSDIPVPPPELVEDGTSRIAFELACMASEACHPGVALSDDPDDPGRFADVDPVDIVRIHRAYSEVNGGRLEALDALVKPTKGEGGGRLSWSVFYATLAKTMSVPARELMDKHSTVALLASSRLSVPDMPELD